MNKRDFLNASALIGAASLSPTPALAAASATGPTLLTVGGLVPQGNRPALDPELDQMMAKHGVRFGQAFTFDAAALQKLPKTRIRPTLEYDGKEHTSAARRCSMYCRLPASKRIPACGWVCARSTATTSKSASPMSRPIA